jgi:excisionase family DNA binding protein
MSDHLDRLFAEYPEQMSAAELAEALGVKNATVYKWLQNGTIPAYQVGTHWLILRDEVKAHIAAHGTRAAPAPDREEG